MMKAELSLLTRVDLSLCLTLQMLIVVPGAGIRYTLTPSLMVAFSDGS